MYVATVALWYTLKSGSLISSLLFFYLNSALTIQGLFIYFCLHTNFNTFSSSSVKNAIGSLIGIALSL